MYFVGMHVCDKPLEGYAAGQRYVFLLSVLESLVDTTPKLFLSLTYSFIRYQ